jgi:prevent-host-death family protein
MLPNLNREDSMEATAHDLRNRPKELLDSVGRGEEVIITYHGKPCARLIPYMENPGSSAASDLFGILTSSPICAA